MGGKDQKKRKHHMATVFLALGYILVYILSTSRKGVQFEE